MIMWLPTSQELAKWLNPQPENVDPLDDPRIINKTPYVWRKSEEYTKWWIGGGSTSAVVGVTVALVIVWVAITLIPITMWFPEDSLWRMVLDASMLGLTVAAIIIAGLTLFSYWAARHAFYERVRAEKSHQIEAELEILKSQGTRRLALADLFVINRRQLDEYHITTIHEQRAAFRNAQIAAAVGFILLVVGVTLVLQNQDSSARYAAASLTGMASILSGFISTIFFKSYTDTTKELRHYYWEPLRTGQILAVERLAGIDISRSVRGADEELRRALAQKMLEQLPEIPKASDTQAANPQQANEKPESKSRRTNHDWLRKMLRQPDASGSERGSVHPH
ncbi:hypothetical protein ACGF3G_45690 [Streptomyces sp. NPDC048179]|uniref:TRADD-N-associated membrane domain-containing protein n=1 Tax=Streptomyces sp. NPDC048179 TaxID=3365506 RepID=UPI0037184D5B